VAAVAVVCIRTEPVSNAGHAAEEPGSHQPPRRLNRTPRSFGVNPVQAVPNCTRSGSVWRGPTWSAASVGVPRIVLIWSRVVGSVPAVCRSSIT
jgi:hypothetical protein